MSGRLVILPKKTYCPWKPENVERVLRDERLERERLEKEERELRAGKQRFRDAGDNSEKEVGDGHINLFPEAREAELRLARGQGPPSKVGKGADGEQNGVLPVPLGGDEATKRKMGAVPFYMRSKTDNTDTADGKYANTNDSFRLGSRRGGGREGGAPAPADEITSRIVSDQYAKREDGRKEKMDPMSMFACSAQAKKAHAQSQSFPNKAHHLNKLGEEERHRKKHHKKRSRRTHDRSDSSSIDSDGDSSASSLSSTSYRQRKRRRRERKHKTHRHNKYPTHSDELRDNKGSRRKQKKRHKRHHGHSSRYEKGTNNNNTPSAADSELEELRRRRQAREARECERARQVLDPK